MRDEIELRPSLGEGEFDRLVEVWHSAVTATHDFLAPEDFQRLERELPGSYLPNVELTVALVDGRIVGFSGMSDGSLEMLFVHDDYRGRGVGSALLDAALRRHDRLLVDVNEQNTSAVAFYTRRGFRRIGRSATDGDGRPYPLLHLEMSPTDDATGG